MSAVIETFIRCDRCHRSYGVDNRQWSATIHRAHAKTEGWIMSGAKDICPDCRVRTKPKK